jgi:hypothetical protein
MGYKSRRILAKIADLLQSCADGVVASFEIVIGDHGGKRPRRSRRTITRVPHRHYVRIVRQTIYRYVDTRTGEIVR